MTRDQIDFIKSLDPEGNDGTIQSIILSGDLSMMPFEAVARHLLKNLIGEKQYLVKENIRLCNLIKESGF